MKTKTIVKYVIYDEYNKYIENSLSEFLNIKVFEDKPTYELAKKFKDYDLDKNCKIAKVTCVIEEIE
jgi:hypothetical protein